jgi:hypothetical protein
MDAISNVPLGRPDVNSEMALLVLRKAMTNDQIVGAMLLQSLPKPQPIAPRGLDTLA